MLIEIPFWGSWGASFLEGSNDEPVSKKNTRSYNASINAIKNKTPAHYVRRIDLNTIVGILCRCVGDQRKLYASREDPGFFFKDLDCEETNHLKFTVQYENVNDEIVFLKNKNQKDTAKRKAGIVNVASPNISALKSLHAQFAWAPLFAPLENLFDFLLSNKKMDAFINLTWDRLSQCVENLDTTPIDLSLEKCNSIKARIKDLALPDADKKSYSEQDFKDIFRTTKDKASYNPKILRILCLREQLSRLKKEFDFEGTSVLSSAGNLPGVNRKGITNKNFFSHFTEEESLPLGNPFILSTGDVRGVNISSGTIFIKIDVSNERAYQIKEAIDSAAVSNFPVGKKGLGYIKRITV